MKNLWRWRAFARSVIKTGGLAALVLATVLASDVEARSGSCPSCHLGTGTLRFENIVTPQFNQNAAGILNASRLQFAPMTSISNAEVNWTPGAPLPNLFQPIQIPDFVLPNWVLALTPEWNQFSPAWTEALAQANAYRVRTPVPAVSAEESSFAHSARLTMPASGPI